MQHSLSFSGDADGDRVVLALGPGPRPSTDAIRLLARALEELGLARTAPRLVHGDVPDADLVIAVGVEAAAMLLRRPVSLAFERGRLRSLGGRRRLLVTEHPDMVLRLSDPIARGRDYRRLVADLQLAVPMPRMAA